MRTVDGKTPTTADLIRTILLNDLSDVLKEDRFFICNSNLRLPTDKDAYVAVKFESSYPMAVQNETVTVSNGVEEHQTSNMREEFSVIVAARDWDTVAKLKDLIPLALRSVYSQQVQEKYAFKIFPFTKIVNTSAAEGAAMLTRFDLSFSVFAWYERVKSVGYYDSFTAELWTEKDKKTINLEVSA